MKKILSLLTLLTVISVGVYAQGISGGLKLGLNLANQTVKSSEYGFTASPSFRPSIHAGGYLTVMISEKFGIQPEVLYSGQGYKQNGGTLAVDYITVPVMFRYNFTPIFSAHLGPQMGFLMSAKAKTDAGDEDMKDYFKGSDFGAAMGIGIDLPMGLNFGVRFVKGLSNIIEDSDSDELKYKNYNLQLSVGYKLFGKK